MKQPVYLLAAAVFLLAGAVAAEAESEFQRHLIEVIDTPTADVLDHYGYNVSFRFGKEGGVQNKTSFGVLPRLNIGFGFDSERLIGTAKNPKLNKPTLNAKFRLFNGRRALPALALGFDGQGYHYDRGIKKYNQREKGLYLVATSEIFIPDLMFSVGGNIFDFDEHNAVRGFTSITYVYEQTLGAMFEWDHATEYKERRLNYGVKYFITPLFTVDLVGRYVPVALNRREHETERVVVLRYTGTF